MDEADAPYSPSFHDELRGLINRHSLENKSGTPDFILAQYMEGCLKIYEGTIQMREKWYGRSVNTIGGN